MALPATQHPTNEPRRDLCCHPVRMTMQRSGIRPPARPSRPAPAGGDDPASSAHEAWADQEKAARVVRSPLPLRALLHATPQPTGRHYVGKARKSFYFGSSHILACCWRGRTLGRHSGALRRFLLVARRAAARRRTKHRWKRRRTRRAHTAPAKGAPPGSFPRTFVLAGSVLFVFAVLFLRVGLRWWSMPQPAAPIEHVPAR